jgi:glycosyltransferase involved in cell wall biosynthesis
MTDTLPKISVVTPSLNQAQHLEATIKGVLDQEYPNLEYFVTDEEAVRLMSQKWEQQ